LIWIKRLLRCEVSRHAGGSGYFAGKLRTGSGEAMWRLFWLLVVKRRLRFRAGCWYIYRNFVAEYVVFPELGHRVLLQLASGYSKSEIGFARKGLSGLPEI